jgi:hypothetical protein
MDSARRIRALFDRLAAQGARWTPLAADAALADLLTGPAARVAGFASDPFAALARVALAPGATVAVADDATARALRQSRPVGGAGGDGSNRRPERTAPRSGALGATPAVAPAEQWLQRDRLSQPGETGPGLASIFRPAQPGTRRLAAVKVPLLPPSAAAVVQITGADAAVAGRSGLMNLDSAQPDATQASPRSEPPQTGATVARLSSNEPADGVRVAQELDPAALAALLHAFSSPSTTVAIDEQGLRRLAAARRTGARQVANAMPTSPSAGPNAAGSSFAVHQGGDRATGGGGGGTFTAPESRNRPGVISYSAAPQSAPRTATASTAPSQRPGFAAMADAVPAPRGRISALSELLHRWPAGSTTSGDSTAAGQGEAATAATAANAPIAALSPRLGMHSVAALSAGMPIAGLVTLAAATSTTGFAPTAPARAPSATDPAEPDRALAPANDLTFTRTLERVLLAELRRQGLSSDSP